jgi:hypothetical protein
LQGHHRIGVACASMVQGYKVIEAIHVACVLDLAPDRDSTPH